MTTLNSKQSLKEIQAASRDVEDRAKKPFVLTVEWHIEDVLSNSPHLTEEQAEQVLRCIDKNNDATVGVNWDVIDATVDLLFPSADECEA